MTRVAAEHPGLLKPVSVAVAIWGSCYTLYRGDYAAGGTGFLPGTPADPAQFRLINAAAVPILAVAAMLPLAMLSLWRRPPVRPAMLTLCWMIAVGCCMHAMVDIVLRLLSLAGLLRIDYPMSAWASIDHRAADLQDLLLNEPWFLLEGLGFAALGWIVLAPGSRLRSWLAASAVTATLALTVVGLLSAIGVIGKLIIG